MKLVAVPVVVRKRNGQIEVHTQTRWVRNQAYDPLYHLTEETCGETVDDWEDITTAAIRGVREELGTPELESEKIIGVEGKIHSTRPEDKILMIENAYCFVQQLLGPQPWAGLGFVVVVPGNFEPSLDKEGEVSSHKWWYPKDLLKELKEKPSNFMGFHYPVLLKVCEDIIAEKLPF